MAHARFRLSTLLLFVTFLAIIFGLGFQIHLLRQQVIQLAKDVNTLKQQPRVVAFAYTQAKPVQSPFRLLNSETIVRPSIEEGMRAGELEQRLRIEQWIKRDQMQFPQIQLPELEGRSP